MKSNEEFIAGIYEKAACYTEEKKIIKVNFTSRAVKIAAMFAVCLGLAGAGSMALSRGTTGGNGSQEHGIALLSEEGGDAIPQEQPLPRTAEHRMGMTMDRAEFTGTVENIDTTERIVWITLEFTEDGTGAVPETTYVAVRWDMLEEIPSGLCPGTRVIAAGALTTYKNAESERFGAAQVVLTEAKDLWIWSADAGNYVNLNGEERQ